MKVNSVTIEETLRDLKHISIPLYQRAYCWGDKEVTTLLDDILALISDENTKHFLGTLVFEKRGNGYSVVDGQQRCTTIFLLLNAIKTLCIRPISSGCTFKPSDDDEDTFDLIEHGEQINNDSNMSRRFKQICNYLNELNEDEQQGFVDSLLYQLYTVDIIVDEDENAYAIFESLNSKGRELEPFDLIRNFLLMKIPEEKHKLYYREYIKKLEDLKRIVRKVRRRDKRDVIEDIEEPYVEKFIRCYIMLSGDYVTERDIYSAFKKAYGDFESNGTNNALTFLRELRYLSEQFNKIINPGTVVTDARLGEQLSRLLLLDTETYFPLALSIIVQHSKTENDIEDDDDEAIDTNTAIELLKIIEIFLIRTNIVNSSAKKSLDKLFPAIGPKLFDGTVKDYLRELRNLLVMSVTKDKKAYIMPDSEFAEMVRLYPLYGGTNSICRLALSTLENELGTSEKISADYTQIEHIMPQTLTDEWKNYLGEGWETIHARYLNTIGNLTFLPNDINIKISNKMFLEKREEFLKSKFALNEYWQNTSLWLEEQIEERGRKLAGILAEKWTAFIDVDESAFIVGKERIADKAIISYTFNGVTVAVPNGKGAELMQSLYTHIYENYPEKFEELAEKQKDLIGRSKTGRGKFRSVKTIGDSSYVVGVSTNLDQKLKDIGRTLQIINIEGDKLEMYTDDNKTLHTSKPGGLRGEVSSTPENVTVYEVELEAPSWAGLYVKIVSKLLQHHSGNINHLPENLVSANKEKMRQPRDVNINGTTYFVEAHSSTPQKKSNIVNICNRLGADKGAVVIDGEVLY